MTKVESSADLINNLLLNLDNLKIQTKNDNISVNNDINLQNQLEMLRLETEKLTKQYTQRENKNKSKKIPPPIITGAYKSNKTKFQTIDDILFELNHASMKTYGYQTPSTKSGKGKKIQGSFVDPRRYSDPYKYTILSTLDEMEDDEEDSAFYVNTPKTPMTALPFYSRKKNLANSNSLKIPYSNYVTPKSANIMRNRSYSQPERYSSSKTLLNNLQQENVSYSYEERTSDKYLKQLHNSINNEKKNNVSPKKTNEGFVKPPRSSSIRKHSNYNLEILKNTEDYYSSEGSDSDGQYKSRRMLLVKKKGSMGLENKPSFQSDITLVNEE